jgi:hypothetical protein
VALEILGFVEIPRGCPDGNKPLDFREIRDDLFFNLQMSRRVLR